MYNSDGVRAQVENETEWPTIAPNTLCRATTRLHGKRVRHLCAHQQQRSRRATCQSIDRLPSFLANQSLSRNLFARQPGVQSVRARSPIRHRTA